MIGHGDGFLESFGLVVNAAGSYGVDISPVFFRLRVYEGVSIDLGRGGYEDPCMFGLCETQAVVRTQGAHFEGLDRDLQVVDRAGGRGKMKDIFQFAGNMDEFTHIMMIEFEVLQFKKVFYVPEVAGDKIIHPDDVEAFLYEPVAQVGAQESCRPGDQHAFFAHGGIV
jgi:hypothetical protein